MLQERGSGRQEGVEEPGLLVEISAHILSPNALSPKSADMGRNRLVPALEPWADHHRSLSLTLPLVKWSEFPPEVLQLIVQDYV